MYSSLVFVLTIIATLASLIHHCFGWWILFKLFLSEKSNTISKPKLSAVLGIQVVRLIIRLIYGVFSLGLFIFSILLVFANLADRTVIAALWVIFFCITIGTRAGYEVSIRENACWSISLYLVERELLSYLVTSFSSVGKYSSTSPILYLGIYLRSSGIWHYNRIALVHSSTTNSWAPLRFGSLHEDWSSLVPVLVKLFFSFHILNWILFFHFAYRVWVWELERGSQIIRSSLAIFGEILHLAAAIYMVSKSKDIRLIIINFLDI
jgi:hypothetical protein